MKRILTYVALLLPMWLMGATFTPAGPKVGPSNAVNQLSGTNYFPGRTYTYGASSSTTGITNGQTGVTLSGVFSGDGTGLTGVTATATMSLNGAQGTNVTWTGATNYGSAARTNWSIMSPSGFWNTNIAGGAVNIANGGIVASGDATIGGDLLLPAASSDVVVGGGITASNNSTFVLQPGGLFKVGTNQSIGLVVNATNQVGIGKAITLPATYSLDAAAGARFGGQIVSGGNVLIGAQLTWNANGAPTIAGALGTMTIEATNKVVVNSDLGIGKSLVLSNYTGSVFPNLPAGTSNVFIWNSNKVLYGVSLTKTNLITDLR